MPTKKPQINFSQKKSLDQLDERTKKLLLWLLVGIFTAFFVIVGIFSLKVQFSKQSNDSIFGDLKSSFSEIVNTFSTSFSKVREVLSGDDEQVVPDDEKITEWEEKVFPEFN